MFRNLHSIQNQNKRNDVGNKGISLNNIYPDYSANNYENKIKINKYNTKHRLYPKLI